jgi:hypothetical protein
MALTKHILSHTTIAEQRVLTSYEEQALICYGSGEIGHNFQTCPKKRGRDRGSTTGNTKTYINISTHGTPPRPDSPENMTDGAVHTKGMSESDDPME